MRMLKASFGISTFFVACMLLSSCSDEQSAELLPSEQRIAFQASYGDSESTRAAQIRVESLESFNVSAYYYTGAWTEPAATTSPNFIINEKVNKGADATSPWTTATNHYWPNTDGNMRFFAYANFPTGTEISTNYTQITDYTVPEKATDQQDIIAAVSDVSTAYYRNSKKSVPMLFHHIFTGIKFATSDAKVNVNGVEFDNTIGNYEIVSIELKKIYATGTFTLKNEFKYKDDKEETKENDDYLDFAANRDNMWSKVSGPKDFSVTPTTSELKPGMNITDGETTLMMIPQSFTGATDAKDAVFVVTLKDKAGKVIPFTHSLKTSDWGMGQMITYSIYARETSVETTFGVNYTVCPWDEKEVVIPPFN